MTLSDEEKAAVADAITAVTKLNTALADLHRLRFAASIRQHPNSGVWMLDTKAIIRIDNLK